MKPRKRSALLSTSEAYQPKPQGTVGPPIRGVGIDPLILPAIAIGDRRRLRREHPPVDQGRGPGAAVVVALELSGVFLTAVANSAEKCGRICSLTRRGEIDGDYPIGSIRRLRNPIAGRSHGVVEHPVGGSQARTEVVYRQQFADGGVERPGRRIRKGRRHESQRFIITVVEEELHRSIFALLGDQAAERVVAEFGDVVTDSGRISLDFDQPITGDPGKGVRRIRQRGRVDERRDAAFRIVVDVGRRTAVRQRDPAVGNVRHRRPRRVEDGLNLSGVRSIDVPPQPVGRVVVVLMIDVLIIFGLQRFVRRIKMLDPANQVRILHFVEHHRLGDYRRHPEEFICERVNRSRRAAKGTLPSWPGVGPPDSK